MTEAYPFLAASMPTPRHFDARPNTMMQEDWKAQIGGHEAFFWGGRLA